MVFTHYVYPLLFLDTSNLTFQSNVFFYRSQTKSPHVFAVVQILIYLKETI